MQVSALGEIAPTGGRPDFVVGTSASVLNAYHFMSQPDAAGVNEREAIRRSLRRQDVFSARLRGALDLLRGGGGQAASSNLKAFAA